ncbi:MAG: hypothetical protein OEZ02_06515, partial [Anaerolineae bacterium]|nr:hypothetical protein [Anaerolineae bacterium]
ADYTKFSLVGFSQGAALSYVFALLHPRRIDRLAGLAGFLPERSDSAIASQPLRGLPVFVAHGAYDKIVPLPLARQAVASLTQAGANLTFCQGEVGHKLGANCFSALQSFFA